MVKNVILTRKNRGDTMRHQSVTGDAISVTRMESEMNQSVGTTTKPHEPKDIIRTEEVYAAILALTGEAPGASVTEDDVQRVIDWIRQVRIDYGLYECLMDGQLNIKFRDDGEMQVWLTDAEVSGERSVAINAVRRKAERTRLYRRS
jgi:hypothetical protein